MKKIYLVLFVILSIFVFSCKDNLISDDLSSSQNSGVGQVKVFVKQSRLIGPDVSEVTWNVKLQKSGENNTISGKNENGYYLFSGLSDGTYNIRVSGKTGDVEKFTGSAVTTITNGNSVSVNVPIVATKNPNADVPSTGYATITMDMSEELLDILYSMGEGVSLVARLLGIDDTNIDFDVTTNLTNVTYTGTQELDSIDIFDNQQITFAYTDYSHPSPIQTTDIPAGYYNLSFVGDFGYSIKLKDNLVEIGDGLTTNIVLTENDYEIVRDYSTVLYVNENGVGDNATGYSLSDPIAFSKITRDIYADLIYLLSDVEFAKGETTGLFPNIASFWGTISSFNSTVRTISANISDYSSSITLGYVTTLKNIKLSGSNKFSFSNLFVDETVILDCEMDNNSTVQLSKKSNLQIGQNFSGDLYVSLFGDWKLGDTVINFENGKPENSNFYIDSECGNSSGQNYSSMFYIDDSGKLAKYTDDFTSFAWFDTMPCLVTKTQAKNKTYTSIYDSNGITGFNGISTYDEENQTWYFIDNGSDASVNTVPSLYKVSAPTEYTDSVTPEKICEVKLDEAGQISINVQDIYIYNDKIYLCNLLNGSYEVYVSNLNDIDFDWIHSTGDTVTALLVKNDVIYIATTFIDYDAQTPSTLTHSAIWRYKWDSDLGDTTAVDTYDQNGKKISVPYYLTQYDDNLTINNRSFPENSTFRITDLYSSEDGSIYGLLANYEDKQHIPGSNSFGAVDVYMRGSVFKLVENSSRDDNSSDPIMNATHLGLRKSFPLTSENLATAKQYFILPRKIVGILNKKLVIVDDGMVPDSNDCNVDRFVLFDLFDLADEISETIDVAVTFSTNGVATTSSPMTFYTINSLFN